MHDLGKRIKELRKGRKLTQSGLGKLLNVSDRTISAYENNVVAPPPAVLKKWQEYSM
ncbi:MAG TPA: helix-turn-helix transcriptional regulator [Firmicutes bacterium]|nr:helix-turn-helix transcriptional regulator [Bacillota bacterium]